MREELPTKPKIRKCSELYLAMKLIVGLGNPGRKYLGTRHNIGWQVLRELSQRYGTSKPKIRFQAETVDAIIESESVLLLCPITFMNASGTSVLLAKNYYRVDNEDLLIVCDDFNLPVAKLRFRAQGSSGGQKGLQDTIDKLDTPTFSRLRIGIGAIPEGRDAAAYVLGKFPREEHDVIEQAVVQAADAIASWTQNDIEFCMNHYNSNNN